MPNINLLPQDVKPKEYALKISNKLRKVAILLLTIFIVSLGISYAGIFFFSQRTKSSIKRQEGYKKDIGKLERTEQRLVLLKNRVDKIDSLMSQVNVNNDVSFVDNLNKLTNQEVIKLSAIDVAVKENLLEVSSKNLSDFGNFISVLLNSNNFSDIYIISLGYSPEQGYKVQLSFPK